MLPTASVSPPLLRRGEDRPLAELLHEARRAPSPVAGLARARRARPSGSPRHGATSSGANGRARCRAGCGPSQSANSWTARARGPSKSSVSRPRRPPGCSRAHGRPEAPTRRTRSTRTKAQRQHHLMSFRADGGEDDMLGLLPSSCPSADRPVSLGARGAVQRERLRLVLQQKPGVFSEAVRENMRRRTGGDVFGDDEVPDPRLYLERLCRPNRLGGFDRQRNLGLLAWLTAGVLRSAWSGNPEGASVCAALLLVAIYQATMNNGSFDLVHLGASAGDGGGSGPLAARGAGRRRSARCAPGPPRRGHAPAPAGRRRSEQTSTARGRSERRQRSPAPQGEGEARCREELGATAFSAARAGITAMTWCCCNLGWVLASCTPFGRHATASLHAGRRCSSAAVDTELFPPPIPPDIPAMGPASGWDLWSRSSHWRFARKSTLAAIVLALNFVYSGLRVRPGGAAIGKPNVPQLGMLAHHRFLVGSWCHSMVAVALFDGEKGSAIRSVLITSADCWARGGSAPCERRGHGAFAAAGPSETMPAASVPPLPGGAAELDPARLRLSGGLGRWPLLPWLPEVLTVPFVEPRVLQRPCPDPDTWRWSGPGCAPPVRWLWLYRLLSDAGLLCIAGPPGQLQRVQHL